MGKEFKSFYKEVKGNEGSKCHYPTRLDSYGCGCQHDCSYCLSMDTQILMYDGSIKAIGDIELGDEVYGIIEGDTYKRFTKSIVTNKNIVAKEAYKIKLSNGNTLICSADHQWLTDRGWKYTTGAMTGDERRPYITENNQLMGFATLFDIPFFEETDDYKKGYLRGVILGDANLKEYNYPERPYDNQYHFRLVLKDEAITDRVFDYLVWFGVEPDWFEFPMIDRSTKEHYTVMAIRTSSKENFDEINDLIDAKKTREFRRGFLAGLYDAEGSSDILIRRVYNTDDKLIKEYTDALTAFEFEYTFDKEAKTKNSVCKTVRLVGGLSESIRFNNIVKCVKCNREGEFANIALKTFKAGDLKIVSIKKLKDTQPLVDITTTTRNFVANGVISHNCYAKSLLDFRKLWNPKDPAITNIEQAKRKIAKLSAGMPAIRLGGMTDPFQPLELEQRVTYEIIKALNEKRQPYLIVTKGDIIGRDEYLDILDPELAHIQVTITCFDDDLYKKLDYEKAPLPSRRIWAVERLYERGFDVQVRLSPFIPEFVDYNKLAKIKCDKIIVEFLRVNTWIKKWFDIDFTPYTVKHGGYNHLPLAKKKELIQNIKGFKEISVCEDEDEAYEFWNTQFNPNPDDCCNLRK